MSKKRSPTKIRNYQNLNPQMPQRDLIINKLRDELIIARGKQKQYLLLKNYKLQLEQKTKQLEVEKIKSTNQQKLKIDTSNNIINDLKKQLQMAKSELKGFNNQCKQLADQEAQLRKVINSKNVMIGQKKKQASFLQKQNERLLNQKYRILNEQDATKQQYQRLRQILIDTQDQVRQINIRLTDLKQFHQDQLTKYKILRDKLRQYENDNNHMNEKIENNGEYLEELHQIFNNKYQQIKKQSQNLIQFQYQLQKIKKQTHNKLSLLKKENQKSIDLVNKIRKVEKVQYEVTKEKQQVYEECKQIQLGIIEMQQFDKRMKNDLIKCQTHLDNLFKQNVAIQQQLQNCIRQDQAAINIIRRKRILPTLQYMKQLRTSRAIKQSRITGL